MYEKLRTRITHMVNKYSDENEGEEFINFSPYAGDKCEVLIDFVVTYIKEMNDIRRANIDSVLGAVSTYINKEISYIGWTRWTTGELDMTLEMQIEWIKIRNREFKFHIDDEFRNSGIEVRCNFTPEKTMMEESNGVRS